MALDWGSCFAPTEYTGRKTRFVVEYLAWNEPVSFGSLTKYFQFAKNDLKRRVSFVLPEGHTKRCQFSSRLLTYHPSAEFFLSDFKKDNPKILDPFIRFYVMDDKGLDIPLVPNVSDITSNTAIEEAKQGFGELLKIVLIGGIGYFAFKEFGKRKRK
ncbi:hypothetical protein [Leptospira biflexa]|uniref:hypothetical protein n=1 Tax=Leptospira biflexa TaxID=172 RepID=UPI0010839B9E|nr:hypothetical protein [Leptospira biflexa]TGM32204.1 hypothetical protein EHQ80_18085 [Leptospira biflexa]TGM42181.1 hypothetical protein EHQ89_01315 [Leptospira biflexa]